MKQKGNNGYLLVFFAGVLWDDRPFRKAIAALRCIPHGNGIPPGLFRIPHDAGALCLPQRLAIVEDGQKNNRSLHTFGSRLSWGIQHACQRSGMRMQLSTGQQIQRVSTR